jgi:hypothetical protein
MLDFTVIFWKENMESNALNGNPAVTNSRFHLEKNSLHIPFYQTNTSQYCPLGAVCETGERGRQKLAKKCPGYCTEYALLYPEHLHMMERYNSLFGIDMRILKEEEILENYIQNSVDRVVIRAW